jgi:predicted  nucleic acid-binding Zn-ribbon protein
LKLLDVQELDAQLDTLNHQLATMPETLKLKELAERHREVDNAARDHRIEVDDLTREQKRADADVEQVKTRQTRDQNLMDSGQVHNPKDLERMLGEVESLKRRISSLEDTELEVMERLETAQASLDERTAELAEVDEQIAAVTAARDKKAGGLNDALITAANDRKVAATGMPEDLMALYEKLRAQKGGVGAAALLQRRCTGCQINLNASDLGIIAKRPSDDVVRCEECDRILVRTGESGL